MYKHLSRLTTDPGGFTDDKLSSEYIDTRLRQGAMKPEGGFWSSDQLRLKQNRYYLLFFRWGLHVRVKFGDRHNVTGFVQYTIFGGVPSTHDM